MVTTILNQARSVKAIDKIMLTRKENTDQEITVNEDMHIYFTLAWLGGISFVIITIVFLAHLYFYMIRYFKIRQQKRKDGIYMLISSPRSHVMLRLVRGQFDPSTITFKNDLNDAEIQLVESIQNMAVINYRGYSMEVNLSEDVSRILNLESAITMNKNKFDRLSQILQSGRATKKIVFLKNGLPIPQELYEI